MSDIKVGDLVVVVRGHECDLGRVFRVTDARYLKGWHCDKCLAHGPDDGMAALDGTGKLQGSFFKWVKRIPPLDELDDVKKDEEITA